MTGAALRVVVKPLTSVTLHGPPRQCCARGVGAQAGGLSSCGTPRQPNATNHEQAIT